MAIRGPGWAPALALVGTTPLITGVHGSLCVLDRSGDGWRSDPVADVHVLGGEASVFAAGGELTLA